MTVSKYKASLYVYLDKKSASVTTSVIKKAKIIILNILWIIKGVSIYLFGIKNENASSILELQNIPNTVSEVNTSKWSCKDNKKKHY